MKVRMMPHVGRPNRTANRLNSAIDPIFFPKIVFNRSSCVVNMLLIAVVRRYNDNGEPATVNAKTAWSRVS